MIPFSPLGYDFSIECGEQAPAGLHDTYRHFEIDELSEPQLRVSNLSETPVHQYRLGGAKRFFGRSGDQFTIRDHGSTIAIGSDWSEISCSAGASTSTLSTIIESQMRMALLDQQKAIVHGSGVEYEGETILFPAWRHTGKTNTMLSFAVRGASFLADDRLFVDDTGTAYSFPTPINLLQYNLRAFPTLLERTRVDRLKDTLSLHIARQTAGLPEHSFVRGVLDYLNNHVIKDSYTRPPSALFDDVTIPPSKAVDKVVLLQTTEEPIDHCQIESIDQESLARALTSITEHEWNSTVQKLYGAYDMLFPEQSPKVEQLRELRSAEAAIYDSFLDCVETYRLLVPEEEDWHDETQRRVVEATLNA